MFTDLIQHIEKTKTAFATIKQDIFNLLGHIQNLSARMATVSERLAEIEKRLEKIETLQAEEKKRVEDLSRIQEQKTRSVLPSPLFPATPIFSNAINENTGTARIALSPKRYVANANSHKVHDAGCVYAKQILPEHRVNFETEIEAEKYGYDSCMCLE